MNRPAVPDGNYPDASLDGWNIGNIHASGYITTVTPKQIIYSDHAEWRLRTRRITRQNVRRLLATGTRTTAPTAGGAQRWQCTGKLDHNDAILILIEDATTILVVAVMWAD